MLGRNECAHLSIFLAQMAHSFDELTAVGRARRLRALLEAALPAWAVDVRGVRLLTNDYNGVFRVDTADGPYALRVSLPYRTDDQLLAECDWLDALDGRVAAPRVIRTRDGAPWAVADAPGVPGSRRATLFRWIPGRAMRTTDDPSLFATLGEMTSALHAHAARWRRPRGLVTWDRLFPLPEEPPIVFDLPLASRQRAIWRDAEQASAEAFRAIASAPQRPRIVHMDISTANAKIYHGRVAVLDFDDCMLAQPVQDLAVSAFRCRSRGVPQPAMRAFRAGYERRAAWPDEALLERFVAASALELANAVYQDFDSAYRAEADRLAASWSRLAREALRQI